MTISIADLHRTKENVENWFSNTKIKGPKSTENTLLKCWNTEGTVDSVRFSAIILYWKIGGTQQMQKASIKTPKKRLWFIQTKQKGSPQSFSESYKKGHQLKPSFCPERSHGTWRLKRNNNCGRTEVRNRWNERSLLRGGTAISVNSHIVRISEISNSRYRKRAEAIGGSDK